MKLYLLSPEIFVAGTQSPSGPPAQLFSALISSDDSFVMTPWIKEQVRTQFIEAGYNEETATDQADFIAGIGEQKEDPSAPGDNPLVAIANALEIDTVYHAQGKEIEDQEGVRFAPVHELLTILTS